MIATKGQIIPANVDVLSKLRDELVHTVHEQQLANVEQHIDELNVLNEFFGFSNAVAFTHERDYDIADLLVFFELA